MPKMPTTWPDAPADLSVVAATTSALTFSWSVPLARGRPIYGYALVMMARCGIGRRAGRGRGKSAQECVRMSKPQVIFFTFLFRLIAGPYESSFSSAQTNHTQTHAPHQSHTHTHRRGSSVVPRIKQRPHRTSEQLDFYATHALISRQLQRDAQLQRNKVEQIIFAP